MPPRLERLFPGGEKAHFPEVEILGQPQGGDEVPVMNGIEASAEQPDHAQELAAAGTGQTSPTPSAPGWKRRM